MMRRRRRTALEQQADSRLALRDAVRVYAALRGATGTYRDTLDVTLRDGTTVTALVTIDLVPAPSE